MSMLLCATLADRPFLPFLKRALGATPCKTFFGKIATLSELEAYCVKENITSVITTNADLVLRLSSKKKISLDDYAGSVFRVCDGAVKVLCLNPLEHFVTVRYGKFIMDRYISKLTYPQNWLKPTELNWRIVNESNWEETFTLFESAILIAVDLETKKRDLAIDIAGYCALLPDGTTLSICIEVKELHHLQWCGKLNTLPQAKVFQNGGYDNAYFLRWGIPVDNYLWDTLHMFHAWYAELPKALEFIAPFAMAEVVYWKDESSGNRHDQLFYNAKDTWATLNTFLSFIREMPEWAKKNYLMEFPLVFPSLHCGMEGLLVDAERRDAIALRENTKLDAALGGIRRSLKNPTFNPGSWQQVLRLIHILGCKDIKSTNVKDMRKAADRHPLNSWFIDNIIQYRKAKKLLSSYLEAELLNGRFLYSLNAAGTDTGRLASGGSAFWCGNQIQNIARAVKAMFMADEGWLLAECDKSQSEDRCVAVLSGDKGLLDIYAGDKDSHSLKGEMFFGIPYDEIRKEAKEATDDSGLTIRDLSKKVNHGSNYNMGAFVLLETMGIDNVRKARKLLRFPANMALIKVCEKLLDVYAKAFPSVKGRWYNRIKLMVATTKKLVGATGWTRYCFGDPNKSKPELNAYVAHVPQSLSVMIVNKEFMAVWRWAVKNYTVIRLKAQIHDSILFQYKIGEDWVVDKVQSFMNTTIEVEGSDNVVRPLCIPTDVKKGLTHWGKL
jgi:hypothetical protein